MSSKSNSKAHKYKLNKSQSRQQQHESGHTLRHTLHHTIVTNTNHKMRLRDVNMNKSVMNTLKRSLDSKMQKQTLKDIKHTEKIQRISRESMIQNAVANSSIHGELDSNINVNMDQDANTDTDVVKRRYYFRELKKIVDSSDILLEVCCCSL